MSQIRALQYQAPLSVLGYPQELGVPPACALQTCRDCTSALFLRLHRAQVEMYADPMARGGVLEPEGIVEIKFRAPDLVKAMHRLDPVIARIKAEDGPDAEAALRAREAVLLPVYRQARHPQAQGCGCRIRAAFHWGLREPMSTQNLPSAPSIHDMHQFATGVCEVISRRERWARPSTRQIFFDSSC